MNRIQKTVCDYLSDLDIECQSWITEPNNSGVLISGAEKHRSIVRSTVLS